MAGVVVQCPTSNEDSYHLQIYRDRGFVTVTDMRLHLHWDSVRDWNYQANDPKHPLNQAVGLVGGRRAKIVQMLDFEHVVVEFSDLTSLDGTHFKEVIHIKEWHKSRWARALKKLRNWLSPTNDPVQEFECYMPVYTCLAMLAAVSPVLFSNSAENWPDSTLLVFYSLGGLLLVVGVICCHPTTRAGLRTWRALCMICVTIGLALLTIHAVLGRQALMASRADATRNLLSA